MAKTIEALFDDPLKRRALYFNLKWKQEKADLAIVLKQRDALIVDKMKLQLQLERYQKRKNILFLVSGVVGFSLGIGIMIACTKIAQIFFSSESASAPK